MSDFNRDRLDIARIHVSSKETLANAYAHAARVSSSALHVKRVGIWFFEDERRMLRCVHLHDASPKEGQIDIRELHAKDFPAYVRALETSRWVCADDARNDPSTREFRDVYLDPLGITSMLDAPILQNGALTGVVCHEHVGPMRNWTQDERAFAGSVADVVALFLEQANRLDAERLAAVGRLAVGVAHDVNNLLAVIDGLTHVAERADDNGRAKSFDEIRATTARGATLMRQLLAFGSGERVALERVDLAEIMRASEVMLHTLVRDRAALVVEVPIDHAVVLATPSHVEQIVMNLVVNARDAQRADHKGTIVVALGEDKIGADRFYALSVRDDGVGMDDETRARVFEPFFTTKKRGNNTGLGLSTVYGLTRQMNGEVRVESTVGKGTTITVLIPVP